MNKEKLNSLVKNYQLTKDEDTFNEIYKMTVGKIHRMSSKIAKSILSTPEEVIAIYEDTLLKCLANNDWSGNFSHYFLSSVSRNRRYKLRGNKTKAKHEMFCEDLSKSNEDSEAATFDIRDDFDLEQTVVSTKKADQRQLIDFLTKDCDAETTAIVQAYMTLPKPSPLAVEKATGICRKKVSRKLNRLAARFSTKQFGDYSDYLIAL